MSNEIRVWTSFLFPFLTTTSVCASTEWSSNDFLQNCSQTMETSRLTVSADTKLSPISFPPQSLGLPISPGFSAETIKETTLNFHHGKPLNCDETHQRESACTIMALRFFCSQGPVMSDCRFAVTACYKRHCLCFKQHHGVHKQLV